MSDTDSCQFRNKSISQLVQQLNNLGDDHVAMHPITLVAIQEADNPAVRRFRSKSISKYMSGDQQTLQNSRQTNKDNYQKKQQFFLLDSSQKKYYYSEIIHELQPINIATILNKFQQGFHTTIVIQRKQNRYREVMRKITPWFQNQNNKQRCLSYAVDFGNKQAHDLLANNKNGKTIKFEQAIHQSHPYYQTTITDLLKLKNRKQGTIELIKLMKKDHPSQLRIILLPQKLLSQKTDDPVHKIIKSQFNQILSYIKTNPTKKYQKISSLLPKRFPIVTMLAQLLLSDSANYILNWVLDDQQNKTVMNGRFDFYDKLSTIVNFIRKIPASHKLPQKRIVKSNSKNNRTDKSPNKMPSVHINTMQTDFKKSQCNNTGYPLNHEFTQQISYKNNIHSMKQLQYCRNFERKTHKYSISEFQSIQCDQNQFIQPDTALFPRNDFDITQQKVQKKQVQYSETEAIVLLKAQHARQVSQYHQTIQNLNKKILILTNQKGISQLYTIHQRQIMHLQLKIQELRKDISKLCSTNGSQGPINKRNQKNNDLKHMIKKLNEEVLILQKSAPAHKLTKGKIKMLQKELSQWKSKYQQGQKVRLQLRQQVKALTNRLNLQEKLAFEEKNIRQNQQSIQNDMIQLSPKEQEAYESLVSLVNDQMKSKENQKYLLRKCKTILCDLSETREIVLDCNSFLVDLQQHLEGKLGETSPQVVLDCNRFIRSYLLDNLDIF